jgi:hypothetical protein
VTLQNSSDATLAGGSYGIIKLNDGTVNDPTVLTLSGVYHLMELHLHA